MDAVIAQFFNVTIMASALPLVLRGLGMTLVVCAVVIFGRWLETRFAWRRV